MGGMFRFFLQLKGSDLLLASDRVFVAEPDLEFPFGIKTEALPTLPLAVSALPPRGNSPIFY